jgi:hypothetical protein
MSPVRVFCPAPLIKALTFGTACGSDPAVLAHLTDGGVAARPAAEKVTLLAEAADVLLVCEPSCVQTVCVCAPAFCVRVATFTFERCQPSQCQLQPLVQPRAAISSNDRTESSYGKPTVNNEHVVSRCCRFAASSFLTNMFKTSNECVHAFPFRVQPQGPCTHLDLDPPVPTTDRAAW